MTYFFDSVGGELRFAARCETDWDRRSIGLGISSSVILMNGSATPRPAATRSEEHAPPSDLERAFREVGFEPLVRLFLQEDRVARLSLIGRFHRHFAEIEMAQDAVYFRQVTATQRCHVSSMESVRNAGVR